MSEEPLSTMAAYSARPTIRVDGEASTRVSELMISMRLTETEGGLSSLELVLSNIASDPQGGAGTAFEDEAAVRIGSTLGVYSGDEMSPQEIFRGVVTSFEADFPERSPPEITLFAEDALQRARMARRTKVRKNMTLADLAREVAETCSLTPVITGLSDDLGTHAQVNESDLAFLRRLLARYAADLQVVGAELHVSPRDEVRRGAITLAYAGQLRRAKVTADLAHQATEVSVTGWDEANGERVSSTSTGAGLGPGAGRTGASMLRDAIGERAEHLGHLVATTDAEARALADAAFDARARRFVCLEGTAEGNAALRVGTHVSVTGLSARLDGTYYVTRACHRFDLQSGYETDFEAESAYLGEPS